MNQRATIILADDDEPLRAALARLLVVSGYKVLEAADGNGVLLHLTRELAGLLITDMLMPGMEGAETISTVRRAYPGVKIIAISGGGLNPPMDYLSLARALGANATFVKPAPAVELLAAIVRLTAQP
jgi:CheY-like chemotaxis protein